MISSQVATIASTLNASDVPLEQLAGNKAIPESQKIAEVARQFEALLLRQVLQAGRKTIFHSKVTEESAGSSIYQDMVTDQLAEAMSKNGTLGLARSLQVELQRQGLAAPGQASQNGTTPAKDTLAVSKGKT